MTPDRSAHAEPLTHLDSVDSGNGDSVTRQWSWPSSGEQQRERDIEDADIASYLQEAVDENRMPENTTAMAKAKAKAEEKAKKKKAKRKLSWKEERELWARAKANAKAAASTTAPRKKPKVVDLF